MSPDLGTLIGARDACILVLFMGCGLRLRGLSALNESAMVWYEDQGREALALRVVEKGGRERLQPVPAEATMLLRAYLGHEELASIPRTLPNGDRVLFVSTNNRTVSAADYYGEARRISPTYIQEMMRKRCESAGVPVDVAHPHALRHLFGAELSEDDTPLLVQQALMGHADPKSTEIYAHIAVRRLRSVVDKANPLTKMRGPLLDSLRSLDRAINAPARIHAHPTAPQKQKSAKRGLPR